MELTAQALPDAQAMEVPSLFPAWQPGTDYRTDDRCSYIGKLYKCLQAHASQENWAPDTAISLWVPVSDPADKWPQWIQPSGAHDAYRQGDQVTHNGKRYISNIDGNVWEPPTQWTVAE